jgi:hypothetical protein
MPSWARLAGPWQLACAYRGDMGSERVVSLHGESAVLVQKPQPASSALGSSAQGEGAEESSKYACIISV